MADITVVDGAVVVFDVFVVIVVIIAGADAATDNVDAA